MNLGQLSEAIERLRTQEGLDSKTSVMVRVHPSVVVDMDDNFGVVRDVEVVEERGRRYVAVMISNSVSPWR